MADQWGRKAKKPEYLGPPCKQIMSEFKWLVPEEQRPAPAPEPKELTKEAQRVSRYRVMVGYRDR